MSVSGSGTSKKDVLDEKLKEIQQLEKEIEAKKTAKRSGIKQEENSDITQKPGFRLNRAMDSLLDELEKRQPVHKEWIREHEETVVHWGDFANKTIAQDFQIRLKTLHNEVESRAEPIVRGMKSDSGAGKPKQQTELETQKHEKRKGPRS